MKIRRQVYVDAPTERRLAACARKVGSDEADLIREGLSEETKEDVVNLSQDPAWQWLEASWAEINATSLPPAPRTWTRDELYDERPKYLSRRH